jgi:small subunit ribosomal protein S33
MAPPARPAVVALQALQSSIFQTTHNPQNLRLGTKYLRRALRGPAVVAYYPGKVNVARLNRLPAFADFATPKRREDGSLIPVVEDGFEECERVVGAGWLDDAKERVRRTEVAERKIKGRGPPKKGELI